MRERPVASSVSRASERADTVLRAAAELFEHAGFAATTMNDIADAVGVLPGSLYHHFPSKEDIALALVAELDRALADLGARAGERLRYGSRDAESLLRELTADVAELSYNHGAAIRIRAWDPPSVATDRMHKALLATSPPLERAWKGTVNLLVDQHPGAQFNASLLRFALEKGSMAATLQYLPGLDPRRLGAGLVEVSLHGLLAQGVSDEELNGSPARAAADSVMARWPERQAAAEVLRLSNGTAHIIAAARHEFARMGYEATTIRDIASAAGVGMGTLYRRVESKEWLVRQIVNEYAICLDETYRAVLQSKASIPQKLDALAWMFVRSSKHFDEEARIVALVWGGGESLGSPVHQMSVAAQERMHGMESVFARGVSEGTLRKLSTPLEDSLHFRTLVWGRYHEFGRTGAGRALSFLRNTMLRGALNPPPV